MASYDEYEYLEQQLNVQRGKDTLMAESKAARGKLTDGTTSDEDNNRRRYSRSRSRSRHHNCSHSSQSRSRDSRHRSRSRSRDESRSHSDRHRASHRSPRRRSTTPPAERMAREKERELRELERATRTIFVYNLSLRADERDLFEFFSKVGRVVDIRLIIDKNTRKSRGLAYIEFSRGEEVISAVALTGHDLKGQPVMVKASEAEKNMAWEAAQQQKQSTQAATQQLLTSLAATGSGGMGTATGVATKGPCWLQVSNLPKQLGDAEIQQLFAPFGKLETVQLALDVTGRSTGFAYLKFGSMDAAAGAMAHWHGRKLLDTQLTVTAMAPPTPQLLAPALPIIASLSEIFPPALETPGADPSLVPGLVAGPTVGAIAPPAGAAAVASIQSAVITTGELDEDNESGGIKMSAQGRVALMSKLAGSVGLLVQPVNMPAAGLPVSTSASRVGLSVDPLLLIQQGVLGPSSPKPTACLLLKNMFDALPTVGDASAQNAAASTLAAEVEEDVREECSRFGDLLHVWVDSKSKGFVYLRFSSTQSAEAAHRALHGRWYGGRQILAEYQFLQVYISHFKLQPKCL
ncbi:hypothetical protein VaNZ11_009502 [Volvox africanus]|uniref:RRM domain-containing protein n=1 Tax=Volvox africanus TaxID=51714 RepID=A0ABQ5S7P6_9CHLO|nr:hypothetical protein VaNZ11_009502 [Volvox africanus]